MKKNKSMESEIVIKDKFGVETGKSYVVFELQEDEENSNIINRRLVAIFSYSYDAYNFVKKGSENTIRIVKEIEQEELLELFQKEIITF